jgi:hypothetical protein
MRWRLPLPIWSSPYAFQNFPSHVEETGLIRGKFASPSGLFQNSELLEPGDLAMAFQDARPAVADLFSD